MDQLGSCLLCRPLFFPWLFLVAVLLTYLLFPCSDRLVALPQTTTSGVSRNEPPHFQILLELGPLLGSSEQIGGAAHEPHFHNRSGLDNRIWLAQEIKKAEMATLDLVGSVKFSHFYHRESFLECLNNFAEDARQTEQGLQVLSAKIAGATDQVLAINLHTAQSIATISATSVLTTILPNYYPHRKRSNSALDTFTAAMAALSTSVEDITAQANHQFAQLEILQGYLVELQDIISREDLAISATRSALLSHIWTKFGGNQNTLKKLNDHFELLIWLTDCHKLVLDQVVFTLLALRAVVEDIGELTSRTSDLNVGAGQIPVEILVKGAELSLGRMTWRISL
ncbi:hypothetical protein GYMLUDRAFT_64587 [Collybiopsis luxurians FD-317 M1]|uniref:Uncharacterized protein n=1 Tax=Collybiopsis luxurians FD-317 M1 TaxID=944289 RepID=A0A0D0BQE1_9AGAR|nr:hypothetical protein GYMLUDRAFT_64587 [Collybiopsis luxurians FD-317 M1]